ncbi:MAG: pilus assembly protein PilZ [Alteromonadaceae bacterium]|nr:MAG: pilus assembly protein PilZ [Alteromonadaceae bacterium]
MNKPTKPAPPKASSKKTSEKKASDQRDFFRIDQDVLFEYRPVDAYTAENQSTEGLFEDSATTSTFSELKRIEQESMATLRKIAERDALLGEYLNSLNAKIDLIARHTLLHQDESSEEQAKERINLSEGGLAFMSERALYKDSYLAIRLIFLPSYAPVISFAKVLRCQMKEDKHHVAAKFYRLAESNRREMSRQILKFQARTRKKARPKPLSQSTA